MRLKFDARARAIMRRLPVVNVYSVVELLLLAALAVQCARLLWVTVTPVAPLGAWAPGGVAVPSDPAGVLAGFDPFYRVSGAAPAQGAGTITSLQLTLFGTRMDGAQARGSAIIAGPDGVQNSVGVGEEVAPGVVLKAVAFDHVTLERGGQAEDLFLDQSGATTGTGSTPAATPAPDGGAPLMSPGIPPPGSRTPPGAALRNAGPISPGDLRKDINAIPRIDGGRITGVTVRGQGGMAFAAAGLRDGDVITTLNGQAISGPGDLDRIARQRPPSGTLSMTVERGGQPLPLSIPVP